MGFLVFRPTVIFRHFGRLASILLRICIPDILSNRTATNVESNKKIATHCSMLHHLATCCYITAKQQ
jgi:hypothetical protein